MPRRLPLLDNILLVARRDYVAAVMRKAFLFGLIIAPIMFGGGILGLGVMRVAQGDKTRHIAILDHAGLAAPIMEAAREKSGAERKRGATQPFSSPYQFEAVAADQSNPDAQLLALSDRVRRRELFGFIETGPGEKIAYYTNSGMSGPAQQWITAAINTAVRRNRLARLGLGQEASDEAMRGVTMATKSLAARDPATGRIVEGRSTSPVEGLAVPFVLILLMTMIAMMGSAPMLSAIAEDKTQKVFEMLLASATPFELMAGKVIASVGVSLTSSLFYIAGGLLALQGLAMTGLVPFALLPWFFIYLICEVTMLSALGAALGAACGTPRDAQNLTPVIILPVMIPLMLIIPLAEQPNSVIATALSLCPPFTPMVMILRQAMPGGVPWWQPWVGLAGILLWTAAVTWAAARIFRIGILLQGKLPKVSELVGWVVRG